MVLSDQWGAIQALRKLLNGLYVVLEVLGWAPAASDPYMTMRGYIQYYNILSYRLSTYAPQWYLIGSMEPLGPGPLSDLQRNMRVYTLCRNTCFPGAVQWHHSDFREADQCNGLCRVVLGGSGIWVVLNDQWGIIQALRRLLDGLWGSESEWY